MIILFAPIALSGSVCLSERCITAFTFAPCDCATHTGHAQSTERMERTPDCGVCQNYSISALASRGLQTLTFSGPIEPLRHGQESLQPTLRPITESFARTHGPPDPRHSILRC